MKIVVTEIPKNPADCMFSFRHCEYGHICDLKPRKVCKSTTECDRLEVIKENKNDV